MAVALFAAMRLAGFKVVVFPLGVLGILLRVHRLEGRRIERRAFGRSRPAFRKVHAEQVAQFAEADKERIARG